MSPTQRPASDPGSAELVESESNPWSTAGSAQNPPPRAWNTKSKCILAAFVSVLLEFDPFLILQGKTKGLPKPIGVRFPKNDEPLLWSEGFSFLVSFGFEALH